MKYQFKLVGLFIFAAAIFSSCDLTRLLEVPEEPAAETTTTRSNTKTIPSKSIPSKSIPSKSTTPAPSTEEAEIFQVVEDMPRFPGCEHMKASRNVVTECAKGKMELYLGQEIVYPAQARKDGVEGTAVVQFIVQRDGSIRDIKIVRDPGSGLGQELARVISTMNEMRSKWTSGRQRGKAVEVLMTVPCKFAL